MAKLKKFQKVPLEVPISELTPFNIGCGSSKCEEGFHCFRMTPKQIERAGETGQCKSCGAKLVNWNRINRRDSRDAEFIFASLRNELFRHVYWHIKIDDMAIAKARQLGPLGLSEAIEARMKDKIGIANPYRKGVTPYTGNIIYYAQHATATCCRRCLQYWYNIPEGRPINKRELKFTTDLIELYIKERLPELYIAPTQTTLVSPTLLLL
jgi:hypothetical protein